MAITDLIANPQGFDPVGRYTQGYATGAQVADMPMQRREREQQYRMREQQMNMQNQAYQDKIQAEQMKRVNAYAADIAPIVSDILQLPAEQQAAEYEKKKGVIAEIAGSYGLNPEKAVSPYWDATKAEALVTKFKPTAETLDIAKIKPEDVTPESLQKAKESGKYSDLVFVDKKSGVTTGEKLPKEQIVDIEELQDSLHELDTIVSQSPDLQTIWSDLGASVLRFGGRLGIQYEGDVAEFLKDKDAIVGYTRKVQDAYRRVITGSQANEYELRRIEGQMPNENDSFNTIKNKIRLWQNISEKINVRYRRLLKNGFRYVGKGKNGSALYRAPDGQVRDIGEIASLDNIKSHEETRDMLFESISNGNPQLSEPEVVKAVINEMSRMGYNVRRYR